jgi:hypothetical protein
MPFLNLESPSQCLYEAIKGAIQGDSVIPVGLAKQGGQPVIVWATGPLAIEVPRPCCSIWIKVENNNYAQGEVYQDCWADFRIGFHGAGLDVLIAASGGGSLIALAKRSANIIRGAHFTNAYGSIGQIMETGEWEPFSEYVQNKPFCGSGWNFRCKVQAGSD